MAAYHSLAVTLGQCGLLKELLNIVESMKEKPKKIRNMKRKNWNPELQPDIIIFNAVREFFVFKDFFVIFIFFCFQYIISLK